MGTIVKIKLPDEFRQQTSEYIDIKIVLTGMKIDDPSMNFKMWHNEMQQSYWVTFDNPEHAFLFKMQNDFEYIS